MDQFGVKKRSLKAIARTPEIPPLDVKSVMARPRRDSGTVSVKPKTFWLEAEVSDLKGSEFSAYGVSQKEGGVPLLDVPRSSEAAAAGLKTGDLVQKLNDRPVKNFRDLFSEWIQSGRSPMNLRVIRNQQELEVTVDKSRYVIVESSDSSQKLDAVSLPKSSGHVITTSQPTRNDPINVLVDGKLTKSYGPIFRNGMSGGSYKMDLGTVKNVTAINSWSFNQNGNRGAQRFTIYGSRFDSTSWDLSNRKLFTPIGSIDTTGMATDQFNVISLRAQRNKTLGKFRWIIWQVSPLNSLGENTAFQELSVE